MRCSFDMFSYILRLTNRSQHFSFHQSRSFVRPVYAHDHLREATTGNARKWLWRNHWRIDCTEKRVTSGKESVRRSRIYKVVEFGFGLVWRIDVLSHFGYVDIAIQNYEIQFVLFNVKYDRKERKIAFIYPYYVAVTSTLWLSERSDGSEEFL